MAAIEQQAFVITTPQREQLTVTNPVTGVLVGSVDVATREDVRAAVERGRAAQPAWHALGVKARAKIILRWLDLMWDILPEMMRLIRAETGKTDIGAFLEASVMDSIAFYCGTRAPGILKPQTRRSLFPFAQRARLYYQPQGVIGIITPWNYPYLMALIDVLPALVAGNAVVLKPSEVAPLTALRAVEKLHESGVPPDVVQIVNGAGPTGAALVDYADYVSFTGCVETGRKVAIRAAERLIPCSLELGGNDAFIVLRDVDLDLAATGVLRGALENAGQVCVSTERVYVEDAIYESFVERLQYWAQKLNIGCGDGYEIHVGSLTNEREVHRMEEHIADAVQHGGRVLHGGNRRPEIGPCFFEPTIITDADHNMRVMREETFGPLVALMRVQDVDEAIRLANDSDYGLSATIFTTDLKRGEQLATRLQTGDVSINRSQMVYATPSLPMGGRKLSGIGRRNGPEGMLRFVQTQSILVDKLWFVKPALTHLDSFTLRAIILSRKLRRWLPFVRP